MKTVNQHHQIRIDKTPGEYAELAARRSEVYGHVRDMMVRSMIEDALTGWQIEKTAKEITDFAWRIEVNIANATNELKKLFEAEGKKT